MVQVFELVLRNWNTQIVKTRKVSMNIFVEHTQQINFSITGKI